MRTLILGLILVLVSLGMGQDSLLKTHQPMEFIYGFVALKRTPDQVTKIIGNPLEWEPINYKGEMFTYYYYLINSPEYKLDTLMLTVIFYYDKTLKSWGVSGVLVTKPSDLLFKRVETPK